MKEESTTGHTQEPHPATDTAPFQPEQPRSPASESASTTDLGQDMAVLRQKVEALQTQLTAADDKYVRIYAEFENFRKRTAQEKLSLIDTASEKILLQILPILDDFERAIGSVQQGHTSLETLATGIVSIHNKILRMLEQAGATVMQLDKGSEFDAELQEAITKTPVKEPSLQGKVIDVTEKGYLLKGKVLRYAKVIIGE